MNLCKLYKFVKYILKTHRGHQCFLTISQISYNFTNSFRAEEKKKNMTDLFAPISNLLNVLLNYYFDSVYGACRGSTLPRNLIQSQSHMWTAGTTSYQCRKARNDRGWAGGWTQCRCMWRADTIEKFDSVSIAYVYCRHDILSV